MPGPNWRKGWSKQRTQWNSDLSSSPLNVSDILSSIRSPGGLNNSFTESGVDVQDTSLDDQYFLGTVRGNIVGLQYYDGEVNDKEMVALIREPYNKYDCNAIRVENTWGEQVGHIKRELAKPIAHICDNRLARIEGLVPFGHRNAYRIPVDISFWGPYENIEAIKAKLSRHGFYLTNVPLEMNQPGSSSGGGRSGPVYQPKSVLGASVKLSHAEMKNQLDKLFEDIKSGDKTSYKEPSKAILSNLYPHQKQALHWMMIRENSDDLPPFWESHGGNFINTLTNFVSFKKPNGVHGGILADDMGLGKTLTLISLVLTNSLDGLPIFEVEVEASSSSQFRKKGTNGQSLHPPTSDLTQQLPVLPRMEVASSLRKDVTMQCIVGTVQDVANGSSVTVTQTGNTVEEVIVIDEEVHKETAITSIPLVGNEVIVIDDDEVGSEGSVATVLVPEVPTNDSSKEMAAIPVETGKKRRPQRSTRKPVKYEVIDDEDENWTPEKKPKKTSADDIGSKEKKKTKSGAGKKGKGAKKSKTVKASVERNPNRPKLRRRVEGGGQRPTATLIVCPVSVLSNWMDQLEEHLDPDVDLKVYLYHGQSRSTNAKKLAAEDIVITTYNTLAHEFKAKGSKSALHRVSWLRVVLDEAHIIRNPSANQTKAILELSSERQWALSGTPIQNNIKDLWSLVSFLKLEPFKTNRQWWQRIIERPIRQGDQDALRRVQKLMEVLALRRTKTQKVDGKLLVELPPKTVVLQYVDLSEEERKVYDSMAKDGKLSVSKYFTSGKLLDHYGDVLAILLRLRQLCCHPSICAQAATKLATSDSSSCDEEEKKRLVTALLALLSQGSDEECCICLDSLKQPVITSCAHVFCFQCILEVISLDKDNARCPLCRGTITQQALVHVPQEEQREAKQDTPAEWHSSAKVDALMQSLLDEREKDPTTKSLVVSQFTTFLNLLQRPLREKGFNFVRLDGSMTAAKRNEAISQFSSPAEGSPTVFLLSLKAGGVGLNLTAANKVFLMEPAWNPAIEDQCFDRCHRLGQTKEVTVTKFIIKDSIEERMLQLQEKKRSLMSEAFGVKASAEDKRKTRVNDVKTLFGL
ncbi:Helicase-like transcription factor [Holothuria leucospilota]|uniref:Helicase-like transcription factor n=1 Tax=Holothuria leucospilota TaxID=206669 RepID=A0A9Q1BPM7_HOLLE|nr:Helicase-like transcription factor [Holothuria leucospilota]